MVHLELDISWDNIGKSNMGITHYKSVKSIDNPFPPRNHGGCRGLNKLWDHRMGMVHIRGIGLSINEEIVIQPYLPNEK